MGSTQPSECLWTGEDELPGKVRWRAVCRFAMQLIVVRVLLRCVGFERTTSVITRPGRTPAPRQPVPDAIQGAYGVAMAAALLPMRAECLERSLVLFRHLRTATRDVTLKVGVRALPFMAHAWVELAGQPVHDGGEQLKEFSTIFELAQ